MRNREAAPLIAAAVLAVAAIMVVAAVSFVGLIPTLDDDVCITDPSVNKLPGRSISQDTSVMPLGVRCIVTADDGSRDSVVVGPGWFPFVALAAILGSFVLISALVQRRRGRQALSA